jgi:hypothetical protein
LIDGGSQSSVEARFSQEDGSPSASVEERLRALEKEKRNRDPEFGRQIRRFQEERDKLDRLWEEWRKAGKKRGSG